MAISTEVHYPSPEIEPYNQILREFENIIKDHFVEWFNSSSNLTWVVGPESSSDVFFTLTKDFDSSEILTIGMNYGIGMTANEFKDRLWTASWNRFRTRQ